jgi:SAM-dependent methyltransferase
VGCGTGILGVAAARLGAAQVVCVDLDAEAVAAAALHARLNRVELRILRGDGCRAVAGRFDVVTANIAAGPLRSAATSQAASRPGALVPSGLAADVETALAHAGPPVGPAHRRRMGRAAPAPRLGVTMGNPRFTSPGRSRRPRALAGTPRTMPARSCDCVPARGARLDGAGNEYEATLDSGRPNG